MGDTKPTTDKSTLSALPLEPLSSIFEHYLVYETSSNIYIVAYNEQKSIYRLLKIDRTVVKPQLLADILTEDRNIYDKKTLMAMLDMINEGNKSTGGMVKVVTAVGIVGFVRFFDQFYLTVITQRKKVATIGNNVIYTIKGTEMIPIKPREDSEGKFFHSMWSKLSKKINQTPIDVAESRYLGLFQFIDMTKDFYFSYTYDLTHSLQYNYSTQSCKLFPTPPANEMFEWNKYQTQELTGILSRELLSSIILPITHGSVQQQQFSIFGRQFDLCLLARRSRHYAGTRYLKRGTSVHGKVANDVEIEQIIQLDAGVNASFASFLQVRGSIPTYWYQETSVTNPKPPILINRVDPKYLATQEHFADLMCRYGAPIIVLDLVKQSEKRKRECLVGAEFKEAVHVLNENMPMEARIRYIALDFSRISSSKSFVSRHATVATGNATTTSTSVASPMPAAGGTASPMPGTPGVPASQTHTPFGPGFQSPSQTTAPNTNAGGGRSVSNSGGDDVARRAFPAPVGVGMKDVLDTSTVAGRLDVLRELDDLASYSMKETDMFCTNIRFLHTLPHLTAEHRERVRKNKYMQQHGAVRTNCIDCLDRTNVAQFAIGVRFLTNALKCMGVCKETDGLASINVVLKVFMEMFAQMGNKISLQYGGSEAHNKMRGNSVQPSATAAAAAAPPSIASSGGGKASGSGSSEAGASSKRSKGGELLTSVKRYYSNSFTDRLKQDAMNLFLGCYVPSIHHYQSLSAEGSSVLTGNAGQAQIAEALERAGSGAFLWDLDSDYFLHNKNLRPSQPLSDLIYFRAEQGNVPQSVMQLIVNKCNNGEPIAIGDGRVEAITAFEVTIGGEVVQVSLLSLANYFFSRQFVGRRVSRTIDICIYDYENSSTRGSVDVSELLSLANQLPDQVKRSIARSELRKRKQKSILAYAETADHQWWKQAISRFEDFYRRDRGLPCPDDSTSPYNVMASAGFELQHEHRFMKPYYERHYNVDVLTTFDAMLEEDSQRPILVETDDAAAQAGRGGYGLHNTTSLGVGDHVRTTEVGAPSLHSSAVPGGRPVTGNRPHAGSHDGDGAFTLGAYFNVFTETVQGVVASVAGVAGFLPAGVDREDEPKRAASGATGKDKARYRGVESKLRSNPTSFYDNSLFSLVDSDPLCGERPTDVESIYCDYATPGAAHGIVNMESSANLAAVAAQAALDTQVSSAAAVGVLEAEGERIEEYSTLYRDYLIDINDVGGMEGLSSEANTSTVLARGLYRGMKQSVSSTVAQEHLMHALMIVENDLRRCVDGESYRNAYFKSNSSQVVGDGVQTAASGTDEHEGGDSESPVTITPLFSTPVVTKDRKRFGSYAINTDSDSAESDEDLVDIEQISSKVESPRNLTRHGSGIQSALLYAPITTGTTGSGATGGKGQSSGDDNSRSSITVDIPPSARHALERFIRHHKGSGTVQAGMEHELYNTVFSYLMQQALYARNMNYERLCKRCSSLTSDQVLLEYMSLYEADALGSSLEFIQYLRADSDLDKVQASTGSVPWEELEERIKLLLPEQRRHLQDRIEVVRSKEWKDILVAQLQNQGNVKAKGKVLCRRKGTKPSRDGDCGTVGFEMSPGSAQRKKAAQKGSSTRKKMLNILKSMTHLPGSMSTKSKAEDALNDGVGAQGEATVYISSSSESDSDDEANSGNAAVSRQSSNKFNKKSAPPPVSTVNNLVDYPGFVTDTYDSYIGTNNPYLRVNEAMAKAYNSYLQETATH